MEKINIPIGFKLITITSLILLISLIGTNYIAGIFFERDTIARIQEVTADKSRLLSFKVQADLTYLLRQVYVVASSLLSQYEAGNYDDGLEEQRRLEELASFDKLFYIAVYSQEKDLVLDQINLQNIDGITDPEMFRDLTARTDFLGGVSRDLLLYNVSSMASTPTIALISPIEREDDSEKYFALVYISNDVFAETTNDVSEYETYIVNHKGDLLAHKNEDLLKNGISFSNDKIVQTMLKSPLNNGQMSYEDRNDIEHIGSFYKIELGSVGVISTAERDRILKAVYQIRLRNYYITGIILLVSVLIIYIFAKTLSTPVRRLVEAAREIEQGNFLLNIKVTTHDEIGKLTESFTEMGRGLDERDRMKDAFGKFVNQEVANMALKGQLRLGGERKEAAVFFSDIRSFTAISEKLTPEEVVEFLNEYMTAMVECVEATHGVVDKFIGDAVMAVWGAPVSHGNDTENAINSALMMRSALEKFNRGQGGDKKPIIKIGCGINTGSLVSGQIGSENRMEYTVIGDAVNLASRIEGLTKPFGADILVSEDSYALVGDLYHTAEMPPIMVKGKSDPVKIYAVLGHRNDPHAFTHIDELRQYLGTENVDLSQFDGVGKEEKFSAV